MKNEFQNDEPRSRFIIRRTSELLRSRGLCVRKFATGVAQAYMSHVAIHERVVRFYDGNGSIDSACRAEKRNAQLVERFLSGLVKFPADLEESWISALPDPERADVVRDLAARYGLIGTRIPGMSGQHPIADLAAVLRDAGMTATALSPLYTTGQLNASDVPHLRAALPIIARAVADFTSLQAQLSHALEIRPAGDVSVAS